MLLFIFSINQALTRRLLRRLFALQLLSCRRRQEISIHDFRHLYFSSLNILFVI